MYWEAKFAMGKPRPAAMTELVNSQFAYSLGLSEDSNSTWSGLETPFVKNLTSTNFEGKADGLNATLNDSGKTNNNLNNTDGAVAPLSATSSFEAIQAESCSCVTSQKEC